MPTINEIAGEKGGVGKTIVAITQVQYALDRKYPFVAVEADRSNPDLAAIYKKIAKFAVFTEDESQLHKADSIFEHAINKPVIVSLPSQSHRAVSRWIERNNLLQVGKEYGVDFCNWFVCNGRYYSVKLFLESLKYYQKRKAHVLVKNWGMCDDWSLLDSETELQKLIKKYGVKTIDFPKLEAREVYLIDKHRLSFEQARKDKRFGVLGQQRVKNFLDAAYAAFDSTGVWHGFN